MLTRSQEMEDTTLPLVTICLITDRNRCPANFTPLTKAHDDGSDADLWKDGFGFGIFNRAVRYLAISRLAPGDGPHEVITDLALITEKEAVPTNFVCIDYTADTKERALKKKFICVRFTARNDAVDAVSDIIVLNRNKRPPKGYASAGDVDGATICFKVSTIPKTYGVKQNMPTASTTAKNADSAGLYPSLDDVPASGFADGNSPQFSLRTAPFVAHQPLAGVAFKVSPRYTINSGSNANGGGASDALEDLTNAAQLLATDEYTFGTERIYVN